MEPALDPIWMGPILTVFVALWFAAALLVFKGRPAKTDRTQSTKAEPPPTTDPD